jgi:hypothetical protein
LSYFLPNLQLNIGKKYLKTAKIIDESLIFAIVPSNSMNFCMPELLFCVTSVNNMMAANRKSV